MKKRTALLAFYVFLGLLLAAKTSAQELAFKAELLFEISTASDEHLLSGPSHISTDSEGNIYVADYYTLDVKQFDSDGAYQRTIGRRGRGPGEVLRITEMHIGHDDHLIVVDQIQYRVIEFGIDYEELDTWTYKNWEMMWPRDIINFNDGYLFLYRLAIPPEVNAGEHPQFSQERRDKLFHVINLQLDSVGTEFGNYNALDYADDELFSRQTEAKGGWVQPYDENSVVFSHSIYDGSLYRFDRNGEVRRHEGYLKTDTPLERLYREPYPEEAQVSHGMGGTVAGMIYAESAGLYRLESGKFVHFTWQGRDEKELYVELFNEELILQAYGTVQGLDYRYFSIEHYADGRFYGIGLRKEEIPVVVVFEMEALP